MSPLECSGEEAFADTRLVVEAVHGGFRTDLGEVAVALFVLGEDEQVIVSVALRSGAVIFLFADVKLATEDGLDADFFGGVEEVHGAEDVAMIGHGHGGHAEFLGALAEFRNVAGAVEHGVIGM